MITNLKFKVWDKKVKSYYFVDFNDIDRVSEFADYLASGADLEYYRFTNQTDSKGKDIYEGDIVKGDGFDSYEEGSGYNNLEGEVFESATGSWNVLCKHTMQLYDFTKKEIIGNIKDESKRIN